MDTIQPASSTTGNPLKQMEAFGQSPWLDFIQRSFTSTGLQELIDRDGLKGITSNPAIFEKAMGHGTDYDDGFKALAAASDLTAQDIYETLAIEDIQEACDRMRPVYDATGKVDGYVSLEVSPYLALRTEETVFEARRLWKAVGRENLMVKVPGTEAGVPAIRILIADGININVTLLFAQSAYEAVAESFIAGLEDRAKAGHSIAGLSSVASFFVSRIDAVMDKKIDASSDPAVKPLRGKIAIANAKLAYQHYLGLVASPRWQALAKQGALPQRLLWASTGVKDKAYSDVLYVDGLIGRDTVNTIPPATMDAFRDHGTLADTLEQDVEGARAILAAADKAGLDLPGVARKLVEDGVQQFAEAADKLLGAVAAKRTAMLGDAIATLDMKLPDDLKATVDKTRDAWRSSGKLRDLWAHDAKVWTGGDEAKWLGWLRVVDDRIADLPALHAFQADVKKAGYKHVMLLGMGGSSLGPEVLAETFGKQSGFPDLLVLDSTDPQQVAAMAAKVDIAHTLFIVSSKSGSTLEPNILKAYFFDQVVKATSAANAGKHFVAVTDPGSKMQAVAEHDGFRHIFMGDPAIGGRYSVLSNFGMVPAAAMGLDLDAFLISTALMVRSCAAGTPPDTNPGVQLGIVLGEACKAGRDKVTIVSGEPFHDVGAWLEQLLAESTGKQGHGIVPVDLEALGAPDVYGTDRVFVFVVETTGKDASLLMKHADALAAAGHPVITVGLLKPMQLGQAFYLFEFATAVAGSVIGIDPFDQPDVEASKIETRKLTDAYAKDGSLPPEAPFLEEDGIKLFTDATNEAALGKGGLDAVIKAHLDRVHPGDYVALLAYIQRTTPHIALLNTLRAKIRDAKHVATVGGFGPRFLHSTGQTYKGGPNSGVFLQITADDAHDVPVPGENYTFGIVKAAQARGDFDVLAERKRRALRVHLGADVDAGLSRLVRAVQAALG
jgi:transaldolase/glucose-6-phosphate isomerase